MKQAARTFIVLVLAFALPLPSVAATHVIAELGTAPLIGQISSTDQLQADMTRQQAAFRAAGAKLGLSQAEYDAFAQRIASRQLSYVILPRHLDAMTWSGGGNVYVIHDVTIPSNTHGWEVDLVENGRQVALFVPARCGNLSVVRRTLPRIAQVPRRTQPVAERAEQTPAPAPAAVVVAPPTPSPTPVPYAAVATSTPTHHFRLWPLLLIPLIGLISGSHSGGIGSSTVPSVGVVGGPTPVPTPTPCK